MATRYYLNCYLHLFICDNNEFTGLKNKNKTKKIEQILTVSTAIKNSKEDTISPNRLVIISRRSCF